MKIAAQFVIPFTAMILAANPIQAGTKAKTFDGAWWMNADYSERAGFIDGFSDCAVWSAHIYAFNTTPEQVVDRITDQYQSHKEDLKQSVIETWQVQAKTITAPKEPSAGETWKNPHWYLNADWWLGENHDLHAGYIEGFAFCAETLLPSGRGRYSRPTDYYTKMIHSYLTVHKSANKVSVASILQRFQDSTRKASSE
jgi:hypothetical protein